MSGPTPFRYASSRRAPAWLMVVDALFRLPSRLLAPAAGTVRPAPAGARRPANDNAGALSARAVNSNIPWRIA